MTPAGMVATLELTLTDEPPLAHAMVIISAAPPQSAALYQQMTVV
jgi:hypothetical protein